MKKQVMKRQVVIVAVVVCFTLGSVAISTIAANALSNKQVDAPLGTRDNPIPVQSKPIGEKTVLLHQQTEWGKDCSVESTTTEESAPGLPTLVAHFKVIQCSDTGMSVVTGPLP